MEPEGSLPCSQNLPTIFP